MNPEWYSPPTSRLNYYGSLNPVIDRLSAAYGIGKVKKFSVIVMGYEDCNVVVETSTSKYVAKMFSKVRKAKEISRYATIMERALAAGVNHPEIIRTEDGDFVYKDEKANGISMVLMRFVKGKTFLELDCAPNLIELRKVLKQAAIVNRIKYHPSYLFDTWAIPNIRSMFKRVHKFIAKEDVKLIEEVITRHSKIPVKSLPHCFVHGDFTKSNIMRGNDGKPYVLDFSVSNWYPRIQELAVIVANLLYDKNDRITLGEKSALVASEYSKLNPLTKAERSYLEDYALAGIAMEFMGSHQEKYIKKNDTEETSYWFNLGRNGLIKALAEA